MVIGDIGVAPALGGGAVGAPGPANVDGKVPSIFASCHEKDLEFLRRHYTPNIFDWSVHGGEGVQDDVSDLELRIASRLRARQETLDNMPDDDLWYQQRNEMRECNSFLRDLDNQQSVPAVWPLRHDFARLETAGVLPPPDRLQYVDYFGPDALSPQGRLRQYDFLAQLPLSPRDRLRYYDNLASGALPPPDRQRHFVGLGPSALSPCDRPGHLDYLKAACLPPPDRPRHSDYLAELRRKNPEGHELALRALRAASGTYGMRHV